MVSIEAFSPDDLSERCAKQQKDQSHERYCMELFRRAIVQRDEMCWDKLVNANYPKLVAKWVIEKNPPEPYTVEDYVQDAFSRFSVKYTAERFARAAGVGSVLKFLKSIAHTTVLEAHRRRQRRVVAEPWPDDYDAGSEEFGFEKVEINLLLATVLACCNDAQEQLVALLTLRNGYMPRQIQERYPKIFPTVRAVSRVKERLFDRLEGCPKLRLVAGKV